MCADLGFRNTRSIHALADDGNRLHDLLFSDFSTLGQLRGENNLRSTLEVKREPGDGYWTEVWQNGVVRRLRSRDGWAANWDI